MRSVTPTVADADTAESVTLVAVRVYTPAVDGAVYDTTDPLAVLEEEKVPQAAPVQPEPVALQFTLEPSLDTATRDVA